MCRPRRKPISTGPSPAAREAFDSGPWPNLPVAERIDWIRKLSQGLGDRRDELTLTITTELGCPISASMVMQAFPPTLVLDKYAELAEAFPFEETRNGMMGRVLVRKEPVGVCGLIVPWNFPISIITFKLGAALAAGCTNVIKAAPETPSGCLPAQLSPKSAKTSASPRA